MNITTKARKNTKATKKNVSTRSIIFVLFVPLRVFVVNVGF